MRASEGVWKPPSRAERARTQGWEILQHSSLPLRINKHTLLLHWIHSKRALPCFGELGEVAKDLISSPEAVAPLATNSHAEKPTAEPATFLQS